MEQAREDLEAELAAAKAKIAQEAAAAGVGAQLSLSMGFGQKATELEKKASELKAKNFLKPENANAKKFLLALNVQDLEEDEKKADDADEGIFDRMSASFSSMVNPFFSESKTNALESTAPANSRKAKKVSVPNPISEEPAAEANRRSPHEMVRACQAVLKTRCNRVMQKCIGEIWSSGSSRSSIECCRPYRRTRSCDACSSRMAEYVSRT